MLRSWLNTVTTTTRARDAEAAARQAARQAQLERDQEVAEAALARAKAARAEERRSRTVGGRLDAWLASTQAWHRNFYGLSGPNGLIELVAQDGLGAVDPERLRTALLARGWVQAVRIDVEQAVRKPRVWLSPQAAELARRVAPYAFSRI